MQTTTFSPNIYASDGTYCKTRSGEYKYWRNLPMRYRLRQYKKQQRCHAIIAPKESRNMFEATSDAYSEAVKSMNVPTSLGFWMIQERKHGRTLTVEEQIIYRAIYFDAFADCYMKILEAKINAAGFTGSMVQEHFADPKRRIIVI